MNKGDRLPDSDHIARHTPFKQIDPSSGLPAGSAFMEKHGTISAGWLERFRDDNEPLDRVRECMARIRKLGGKSKLAVLHVGASTEALPAAKVVYDPCGSTALTAASRVVDRSTTATFSPNW